MPRKESRVMDIRVQWIEEYQEGESVTALAETYGIARKTIYKWLERYASEGVAGLADRSRVPHRSPDRLSEESNRAHCSGPAALALGAAQAIKKRG